MKPLYDNKYRFVQTLGKGGFGKVFLAKEERSENLVAIKQLNNEDKLQQEAIIHEMQIVSKFNHPNIVAYKHHFNQDGLLFIVTEYCSIGSLRDLMRKEKIISTYVWKWLAQLTETLHFVHEKQIVHHDIKPDNILFTENRTIKLADFGVANQEAGTPRYMCPEAFEWDKDTTNDPRVDIYALGVTLLEVLTNRNPFLSKSIAEIIEIHDRKEFGINNLPNWQQEIIYKAIAKIPEQRFQTMKDFNEAIIAQSVPIIFDKEVIQAGALAEKAGQQLRKKKWSKAITILQYAEKELKPNVNVMLQKGKYHLLSQQIELAKTYYERALKWNPRSDVQKELGWLNLELRNYSIAISLLSDHVHRNPSDYEAYNLLLQCFYETNRYEQAMDLCKILLDIEANHKCFINNYYIFSVLQNPGQAILPKNGLNKDNYFLNYNYSVVTESEPTYSLTKEPYLKSKLLFMDYRFNNFNTSTLYCTNGNIESFKSGETQLPIIKFGRDIIQANDVTIKGGASISRRHCLIINSKDDVWIYDLDSTGTYVNGELVITRMPLIGKNLIRIGKTEFELTNDKNKLF